MVLAVVLVSMPRYSVPVLLYDNFKPQTFRKSCRNQMRNNSFRKILTRQYLPQNLLNDLKTILLHKKKLQEKLKMNKTPDIKLSARKSNRHIDVNCNVVDTGSCKMISDVLQHYELGEKFDSVGALPVLSRQDDPSDRSHFKSRRVSRFFHILFAVFAYM